MLTSLSVGGHSGGQTHARGAATSGGHGMGRDAHHGAQHLRLGHTRVAHLKEGVPWRAAEPVRHKVVAVSMWFDVRGSRKGIQQCKPECTGTCLLSV